MIHQHRGQQKELPRGRRPTLTPPRTLRDTPSEDGVDNIHPNPPHHSPTHFRFFHPLGDMNLVAPPPSGSGTCQRTSQNQVARRTEAGTGVGVMGMSLHEPKT